MCILYNIADETIDAALPEFEDLYGPKLDSNEFKGSEEFPTFLANDKFANRWITHLKEVIDNYNPDLIYFDNKMNIIDEENRLDFLRYYYNHADKRNQDVVVTYKAKDLQIGAGVLDLERARMSEKKDFPWLTDDSMDWGSWCNVMEPDYKSTNRMIDFLVDVVSKNGGVLLNITPTAEGEIPQPIQDRLLEIGDWFKVNGEAIYGTRPFTVYGEGPQEIVEGHLSERQNKEATAEDIRFTTKGNVLYAIAMDWPKDKLVIRSLGKKSGYLTSGVKSINLLGSAEILGWDHNDDNLTIYLPKDKSGDHSFSFKIVSN